VLFCSFAASPTVFCGVSAVFLTFLGWSAEFCLWEHMFDRKSEIQGFRIPTPSLEMGYSDVPFL